MTCQLIVIVGQTASGKSALAMELAERFDGEIICADSRTVYKGMDIGTAKPTPKDRARVPHHLLDIVEPNQAFNVATFKELAVRAIDDIGSRGKVPLLVGGSGLYIDSVLYDFAFGDPADMVLREQMNALRVNELQDMIRDRGLSMPENTMNKRYLIRTLERNGKQGERKELRPNTIIIGLEVNSDELRSRIEARTDVMIGEGFAAEVRDLVGRYGWDAPGLLAPGYKAFRRYLEGTETLYEARLAFIKNDMALAKRQRTWFKRNKSIQWFSNREEVQTFVDLITSFLNKD